MEGRIVGRPFVRWFEDEIWPNKINRMIESNNNSESDRTEFSPVVRDENITVDTTSTDELKVMESGSPETRQLGPVISTSKEPSYCQVLQFTDHNGQKKEMIFPKGLDLDRPKRERTSFSASQLQRLEDEFTKTQYMVGKDRCTLADKLNLSETQVKVWFQNRRTKFKRERTKLVEMRHVNAESIASRNILHLIDSSRPPIPHTTNLFY